MPLPLASAAAVPRSSPGPDVLDAIAAVAWTLEPLAPHERAGLLKDEAAFLIDGLLTRVARGSGALDVALGEGLDALATGDRALRLSYSGIGDYACERLGMAPGTAVKLARLARALRDRPLLREAVRRGEVSARKAETVLPVARGDDEAAWVERARSDTVRALAAAVKDAGGASAAAEDLDWQRVTVSLPPEARTRWDAALEVAGALLGATAPAWQRIEVICEEYLGVHPAAPSEEEEAAASPAARSDFERDIEAMKEALELETSRWQALSEPERFEAPQWPGEDAPSPPAPAGGEGRREGAARPREGAAPEDPALAAALAMDARLRELAAMRDRWDALVGHLGMLLQNTGLWRHMCFLSLGHYAAERLGMSGRALEQRAALERRLWDLPALRDAMRSGRVSYEKARLVAAHADDRTVAALIVRAEVLPCIALRRELEDEDRAQMCTRGELTARLPGRVALLLAAAIRAARDASGRWLPPGEALAVVADHFVETWRGEVSGRKTLAQRVLARDRGRCQVPGCSRAAVHAHHVVFRSRGGLDRPDNLASLCSPHHLHGVHAGWLRVRGQAPEYLRWELAAPPCSV